MVIKMNNDEKSWDVTIKSSDGKTCINTNMIPALVNKYINHNHVQYAFLTTYDGMDISVLGNLLLELPGGNELIREERFDVCYGAKAELQGIDKTDLSEKLQSRLHPVLVEGAFHSKIYLFLYRENQEDKMILIIGSKNITSSKFLDNYVLLIGSKTNGELENNGNQLKKIISSFPDVKINECIKELEKFNLASVDSKETCEISFCKPDIKIFKEIFKEIPKDISNEPRNSEKHPVLVVSPFVSLDEFPKKCYVKLLSRKEELDKLRCCSSNVDLYDFNSGYIYSDSNIVSSSDFIKDDDAKKNNSIAVPPLHAKLYCLYNGNKTIMYIGSANFTYSAFSGENIRNSG